MADSLSMNIPAAAFIIILLVVFRQYGMQLTIHSSLQKTQNASINPAFSIDLLSQTLIYLI